MFREGDENYEMNSHGRARKNEGNSRENSRDRTFSLVSDLSCKDCCGILSVWTDNKVHMAVIEIHIVDSFYRLPPFGSGTMSQCFTQR